MSSIKEILKEAVEMNASDIFIVSGTAVSFKVFGNVMRRDDEQIMPADAERLIKEIFGLAELTADTGSLHRETDFSFSYAGVGRFRVNVYRQRGTLAAVLRNVLFELPDSSALNIPDGIMSLTDNQNGIILITGAAGSGKSTTLTCMIDKINTERQGHIVTIEDPIEFLHRHKQSIISQREIGIDTESYADALRAALRQSPNVILLGEMRDNETMSIAMTAAETGQLVLSTLHTLGAVNTIDRIIDSFPTNQQQQIRMQLAMVLKAVVSQQLLPDVNGTLHPVFEIMTVNNAVRTMIRDSKTHQIETVMQTSAGMQTMDTAVFSLCTQGVITAETAVLHASNPEMMSKKIALFAEGKL
ncbi:MAG: PilT/PilU family type 4a pilus ATPase [Ruminococcus sp.]|nr:PilT/PilU family type 4a pilus ATPase [Ruminococcus sp.]